MNTNFLSPCDISILRWRQINCATYQEEMIKNETDLIVEHQLSGRVRFVEEVEVVQHGRVREHEVHDLMAEQAAQLSHDLKAWKKIRWFEANKHWRITMTITNHYHYKSKME